MSLLESALANEPYLSMIFDALRARRRPVLIEAGANDGYHTRVFQEAVPNMRHCAFEPDPRNLRLLAAQGQIGSAEIFPFALGDVTGIVPFHLATPEPNGAIGASSLSAFTPDLTASFPWLREDSTIEVYSFRLDDFLAHIKVNVVDLLWMDVQGAERLVFAGMRGCWRSVRHIFTEHDGGYADSRTLQQLVEQLNKMAAEDDPTTQNPWTVTFAVPGNAFLTNRDAP